MHDLNVSISFFLYFSITEGQTLAGQLVVRSLQQAMIMMLLLMNLVCTSIQAIEKFCLLCVQPMQ